MRKAALAFCICAISLGAFAQPSKKRNSSKRRPSHTSHTWKTGALVSVVASQGSSKNWSAGAQEFALSLNAYANLFANKKWGKNNWDNSLEGSFGIFNTTGLGVRKNDDRVDFRTKYTYDLTKTIGVGILGNFRSQFTDGYDYSDGMKRRISDFFAPAYFALGPGFEWKLRPYLSVFVSPAAGRAVVFTNKPYSYMYQGGVLPDGGMETPLASKYGVMPNREVDGQFGTFVNVTFAKEVFKNVTYRTRADLFSNYLQAKPLNIDVFWTNTVIMKVNKVLAVTYNFDVNYDDDIRMWGPNKNGTRFQFRSLLGVGIAAKL